MCTEVTRSEQERGHVGVPPGHAHMPVNRGVSCRAIDDEVMASRLALDGGADRGVDEIVPCCPPQRLAQIGGIFLAQHI